MPLKKRIGFIFLYGIIAVIAISVTSIVSLVEIRSEAARQAELLQESHIRTFWELLGAKGRGFEIVNGRLVVGDYVINGNFEVPDKVKEIFGGTATVFMGDVRVSTNVLKEDGSRAIGTRLTGPAHDAVFKRGVPFRGESLILGTTYFVAYDPIRDVTGKVIGALYVGVKKNDFFAAYNRIRSVVVIIHVILIGVFIILTMLLLENRRQAEAAIREREERLKLILEGSNDGAWDWNMSYGVVQRNQRWVDILGYRQDEIKPSLSSWESLLHPDDMASVMKLLGESSKGLRPRFEAEYRLRCRTGEWKWILDRGKVVEWDRDGTPRRMTGTVTDITDRRQAELELRQTHRLLQTVFSSLNDALLVIDRTTKTIIDCNAGAEKMFGYSWTELIGNDPEILYENHEMAERFRREAVHALESRGCFSTEYQMRKKNGEVFAVEKFCNPTAGESDDPSIIVCLIRDITERKQAEEERDRLEEQLRHAQKMEAVGQLAGGVAHDFNNILTAIMGYGHLLKLKMGNGGPLMNYVESIIISSERAAALTQGLLAFSRKQVMNPRPVDLNGIVGNLRKFMERIIGEDIELRTDLIDRQLVVMADTGQMEQVLMNLATNARDAMQEGGSLLIRTGMLENGWDGAGHDYICGPPRHAYVSVTDTGTGMDENTREKLFEPFFTTKEVGKGTGLGLSIVYGIIKQHNGRIRVESELGRGSTFMVSLPLVGSEAQGGEVAETCLPPNGMETILVAEDDEEVRKLDRFLLEESGYTVIEAADGEDAVVKFTDNRDRIRLVILDVIMPKKNGKEAFQEISSIRPGIRVIFMSGYTADVICRKGVLDQGLDFVEKPIVPLCFLRKVREVLDRGPA